MRRRRARPLRVARVVFLLERAEVKAVGEPSVVLARMATVQMPNSPSSIPPWSVSSRASQRVHPRAPLSGGSGGAGAVALAHQLVMCGPGGGGDDAEA